MRPDSRFGLLLALCVPVVVGFAPAVANACGGTFCDAGPQTMPVDQTGESIVFWIDRAGDEPFTEAHVQIEYEGDAERFAWIIPVTAVPEVSVGSQALFDNLLSATVPTFTLQFASIGDCNSGFDLCGGRGPVQSISLEKNGALSAADGAGTGGGSEQSEALPGPDILDRGFAGAFEYVTLTGDSVNEVVDWLEQAGYAQDPDALPILAEYLEDDFVFVAIKLRSGAGVDAIHPLTIRYPGTEPCIPIRLTRIAAVEDMAIRAFFLGESRVAPQNWPHVTLNQASMDWFNGAAASYLDVVSQAIDEAGGRAFMTEYAGTGAIVSTSGLSMNSWDASAFTDLAAVEVVDELVDQGLITWGGQASCETCRFRHPLVRTLLETYLPAPPQLDPIEFWTCPSCYEAQIDPDAWDSAAFAQDFDERIVIPGQHAVDMLSSSTYLTRLFTLISPHEMLEDPLFHETELGDVSGQWRATLVTDCGDGPSYLELDDGRQLVRGDNGVVLGRDELPAAERIERVPMVGPAQVEVDNQALIDELIDEHNDAHLRGPQPSCSISKVGTEAVLTMFAIFGIAWHSRRK